MALVMKCRKPKCRHEVYPLGTKKCRCCGTGALLEQVDDPGYVQCRACGGIGPADASVCGACGGALKRRARLRFPWGEEILDQGARLVIGRNGQEPEVRESLADRLADPLYGTVSKRHAELFWRGDELVLRDLASKNGTSIGGNRVAPNDVVPITGPCRLRLSSRLEIDVDFDA